MEDREESISWLIDRIKEKYTETREKIEYQQRLIEILKTENEKMKIKLSMLYNEEKMSRMLQNKSNKVMIPINFESWWYSSIVQSINEILENN